MPIATDRTAESRNAFAETVDDEVEPSVRAVADPEPVVREADALEEPALGRMGPDDVTLFCSVGLASTEVVLGSRLLEAFA